MPLDALPFGKASPNNLAVVGAKPPYLINQGVYYGQKARAVID